MPSFRAIAIFDLDGTLVDSRRDIADAGNAARRSLGLAPLPLEEVIACVGDGVQALVERLTPVAGAEARRRAFAAFTAAYDQCCCRHTGAYPGIAEALAELQAAGWALGVATNKTTAFSERILAHCGIRERFLAVRGGDRTRKPDPTALNEIIAASGCAAAGGWMIGDHHTDILAGHAAGLSVAWAGWGFGQDHGLSCERTLAAPAELPAALLAA
jgi:phosphoglycolate phosphatase